MDIKQFELPDNETIFFADSFKLPLFNDVMEQELIKVLEWLKKQPLDNIMINGICRIVNEIIDINAPLIKKVNFNTDEKGYGCSIEYKLINPKIRVAKPCYICSKQYTRYKTKDYCFFIMRTMSNYCYKEEISSDDYPKYLFLYRFFLDLYADIDLFIEVLE